MTALTGRGFSLLSYIFDIFKPGDPIMNTYTNCLHIRGRLSGLFAPKTHYRNKMWIDSLTKMGPTNLLFPVFILMTYMIRHFN